MRIYWNDDWGFTEKYSEDMVQKNYAQENLQKVRLPHTNVVTPLHYFNSSDYEMLCGYRKVFFAPQEWTGKHILITFEGAAQEATVYLNGTEVLVHKCGYTAFSFEMTPYLKIGEDNVLTVRLDTRESLNQPPFGNVIDYLTYGGLYREVYIDVKNEVYIEDVELNIERVMDITKMLQIDVRLNEECEDLKIQQTLLDIDGRKVVEFSSIQNTHASYGVTDVEMWSTENPKLYQLHTILYRGDQKQDEHTLRFAFREAKFGADGFYLNGKKLKIRGLNRHQSYPYVGYAMPERPQKRDVDILVDELGVNAVRTSHYPQSQHFLNACDERGLLVFTEIPGWQHIGDEEWKEIACENVREMVLQNKYHPSIILWGVRINESQDDDAFYKKTNKIAHELDHTRQTAGVRYLKKSHLYEDVYSFNEFRYRGFNEPVNDKKNVSPNQKKGYFISEFNGHMFPTKSFDKESVRLELALRTAAVMNGYYAKEDIAGGFGWCMFDYNTHSDFGSGDKICYHGAMDMFRNPKSSAAVYASQQDKTPYFELSSSMDIGEHPACYIGPVYAFTNADSIKVYKGDRFVKEFLPERGSGEYGSLPHPPIVIDDFIGDWLEKEEKFNHRTSEKMKYVMRAVQKYGMDDLPCKVKRQMFRLMLSHFISLDKANKLYYKCMGDWGGKIPTYRFEAIKNGEIVKTIVKAQQTEKRLILDTDTTLLVENNSYDVASVRIHMEDENGNLLHYYQEPLILTVSGDLELIGPSVISLKGGMGGCYVKSVGGSGNGTLHVETTDGVSGELRFNVLA